MSVDWMLLGTSYSSHAIYFHLYVAIVIRARVQMSTRVSGVVEQPAKKGTRGREKIKTFSAMCVVANVHLTPPLTARSTMTTISKKHFITTFYLTTESCCLMQGGVRGISRFSSSLLSHTRKLECVTSPVQISKSLSLSFFSLFRPNQELPDSEEHLLPHKR